jgi:hypothetical protein
MSEKLHGFPFWLLTFDKDGKPTDASLIDRFVTEFKSGNIEDLFIFSIRSVLRGNAQGSGQ